MTPDGKEWADWLTADFARDLLRYDEEDGSLYYRKSGHLVRAGDKAGHIHNGYASVNIKGRNFRAHVLIWLIKTGALPTVTIDHIDRDRSNNRWANLRLATRHDQHGNMPIRRDNSSGVRGVSREGNRWKAQIRRDGKKIHIGYFADVASAKAAYDAAAKQYFGEFYNHG